MNDVVISFHILECSFYSDVLTVLCLKMKLLGVDQLFVYFFLEFEYHSVIS